jgi:hypothetical protein
MALFFECMLECARKYLTRADIVREAIFRLVTLRCVRNAGQSLELSILTVSGGGK